MKGRVFNSLFIHLFLVILLATLPAFIIIYRMGVSARQESLDRDRLAALQTARGLGLGETLIISMAKDMMQSFIDAPEVHRLDVSAIRKRFKIPVEKSFQIKALLIFDTDANLLGHTGNLSSSYSVNKKEVLEMLNEKDFIVGTGVVDNPDGFFILPCYQTIYSKNGEAKGVLCILLDTEQHYDALTEELEISKRWRLIISDKEGRLLYVFPEEEKRKLVGRMESAFAPVIIDIVRNKNISGNYRREIDTVGEMRIGGYFPLRLTEQSPVYGYIFMGTSETAVIAEARRQWGSSILHYSFFIVIVFIAILYLARRLFEKPLLQITDAAQRFKDGEHAARSGITTAQNEVIALSKVFDDMAQTIELRDKERMEMLKEFEAQASTDMLTGVFNRRAAEAIMKQSLSGALRHKKPMSLCFIDLDGFKDVNDSYGHSEGDHALSFVARLLRQAIRLSDSVCRMGGDEFLLVLPECDEENAVMTWDRIQAAVDAANGDAHFLFDLQLSHGIATFDPEHPVSLDVLIALADERMYANKKRRKDERLSPPEKKTSDWGFL